MWLFFDFSRWRRRHLGFSKFQIFNGRKGQEGLTPSARQISSKSVKPQPRYGDFAIFQDGGRRNLGFLKFQIFNGRTVKRVELRQHAKLRRNRSNRG